MAVSGRRVTVTTAATLLVEADDGDGVSAAIAVPSGGSTVDLGGSGVIAGAGFRRAADKELSIDLSPGEALYGVVASGTQVVDVIKNRVDS